jgi:hypothetical protein
MTRGDNRKKILAGWRATYDDRRQLRRAALFAEGDARAAKNLAEADRQKSIAHTLAREMAMIERTIRAYAEEKLGQLAKGRARQ